MHDLCSILLIPSCDRSHLRNAQISMKPPSQEALRDLEWKLHRVLLQSEHSRVSPTPWTSLQTRLPAAQSAHQVYQSKHPYAHAPLALDCSH